MPGLRRLELGGGGTGDCRRGRALGLRGSGRRGGIRGPLRCSARGQVPSRVRYLGAGSGTGGRLGARLGGLDRRRPGHRQVHPAAAGLRLAGRRTARCSTSPARSPRSRSACGPRVWGSSRRRHPAAGGDLRGAGPRGGGDRAPRVMVVDSIQTLYTELLQSAPGSVSQVRETAAQLVRCAKQADTAVFLVGHVTKEGALAGRGCWSTWSIRCSTSRARPGGPSAWCARSRTASGRSTSLASSR